MEAQDAARTDDTARQAAALEELQAAQEEMGCVGGLLILMALQHGGLVVQKKLAKVFGGVSVAAWEKAERAQQRATDALEMIDVLKAEVKELRRQLERQRSLPELTLVR